MVRSQVWGRTTAAPIPRSNSRRKGGQMFTKRFGLEIEFTGDYPAGSGRDRRAFLERHG